MTIHSFSINIVTQITRIKLAHLRFSQIEREQGKRTDSIECKKKDKIIIFKYKPIDEKKIVTI